MFNVLVKLSNPEQVVYSRGDHDLIPYNTESINVEDIGIDTEVVYQYTHYTMDKYTDTIKATTDVISEILEKPFIVNGIGEYDPSITNEDIIGAVKAKRKNSIFFVIDLRPTDPLMEYGSTHITIAIGYDISSKGRNVYKVYSGTILDPDNGPRMTLEYYRKFLSALPTADKDHTIIEKVPIDRISVDATDYDGNMRFDYNWLLRVIDRVDKVEDIPPLDTFVYVKKPVEHEDGEW